MSEALYLHPETLKELRRLASERGEPADGDTFYGLPIRVDPAVPVGQAWKLDLSPRIIEEPVRNHWLLETIARHGLALKVGACAV